VLYLRNQVSVVHFWPQNASKSADCLSKDE